MPRGGVLRMTKSARAVDLGLGALQREVWQKQAKQRDASSRIAQRELQADSRRVTDNDTYSSARKNSNLQSK